MDNKRILIIDKFQKASKLCSVNTAICFKKEAAIWNIAACLMKGKTTEQANIHAPLCLRCQYTKEARKRITNISNWADKNLTKTSEICAPYITEYKLRAEARAKKEMVS